MKWGSFSIIIIIFLNGDSHFSALEQSLKLGCFVEILQYEKRLYMENYEMSLFNR